MSKSIWLVALIFVSVLILNTGCAPSVLKEDFDKVKAQLTDTQTQLTAAQGQIQSLQRNVSKLSAISAYTLWYDQYYTYWNYGSTIYQFADRKAFTNNFGTLIEGINDSTVKQTWKDYQAVYDKFDALLKSLPADDKTWDKDQIAQYWKVYYEMRVALGTLGTPIYNIIVQ